MTALKALLRKLVGPSGTDVDYPILIAAFVAGLVFIALFNIHAAIQRAAPGTPSGVVYPIHSGP
jgi:hypothetical protein